MAIEHTTQLHVVKPILCEKAVQDTFAVVKQYNVDKSGQDGQQQSDRNLWSQIVKQEAAVFLLYPTLCVQ